MPYIKQANRAKIDPTLEPLLYLTKKGIEAGELNYIFTRLAHAYMHNKHYLGYTSLNEVVGVLESAKAEFQRRFVVPYEDEKIKENGDV